MKQNKYFSMKRFANLLRNDWLINQKTYLFTLAGFALIIYGISYISMYNARHFSNSHYTGLFMLCLLGIGAFTGTAFPSLTDQIKKSTYLLLPGSIFEKFMVQFIIRIVIFIPLALFLFWVVTRLAKASLVPNPVMGFYSDKQIEDFHFWNLFNEHINNWDRLIIILSFFSITSFLFAGSAYFKRFALVKTLIVFGGIIWTVSLLFVLFSHIFFPDVTHGFDIEIPIYNVWKDMRNLQLLLYLFSGISWLFFLPLTYFKLKEKEV